MFYPYLNVLKPVILLTDLGQTLMHFSPSVWKRIRLIIKGKPTEKHLSVQQFSNSFFNTMEHWNAFETCHKGLRKQKLGQNGGETF